MIGADANPYVALAATLACGYLGIKNSASSRPPECTGRRLPACERELPRSLGEAVCSCCAPTTDLAEVLGAEFLTVYAEVKELEHAEFMKVISPWEREHLLLGYAGRAEDRRDGRKAPHEP